MCRPWQIDLAASSVVRYASELDDQDHWGGAANEGQDERRGRRAGPRRIEAAERDVMATTGGADHSPEISAGRPATNRRPLRYRSPCHQARHASPTLTLIATMACAPRRRSSMSTSGSRCQLCAAVTSCSRLRSQGCSPWSSAEKTTLLCRPRREFTTGGSSARPKTCGPEEIGLWPRRSADARADLHSALKPSFFLAGWGVASRDNGRGAPQEVGNPVARIVRFFTPGDRGHSSPRAVRQSNIPSAGLRDG